MTQPAWRLNISELARIQRMIRVKDSGCWEWIGKINSNGYGWHTRGPGHTPKVAHRLVWEHYRDQKVPHGLQLDHICRNRRCCNPDHLEPVTPSENTRRQDHANRNKTHCPKGHEYTPDNTRLTRDGKRVCRACDRARYVSKNAASAVEYVPSPPPGTGVNPVGGGT